MKDLQYIKDNSGKIIKVVRGNKQAVITWTNDNSIDIDYVNTIIMIILTQRGVGGDTSV